MVKTCTLFFFFFFCIFIKLALFCLIFLFVCFKPFSSSFVFLTDGTQYDLWLILNHFVFIKLEPLKRSLGTSGRTLKLPLLPASLLENCLFRIVQKLNCCGLRCGIHQVFLSEGSQFEALVSYAWVSQ